VKAFKTVIMTAVLCSGGLALAQAIEDSSDVDVLVAQGEALAQKSQFSVAIEKWKAADRKLPRAKHSCLIGLAYTRRELWPQAEIFLAQCRARATVADPVPPWLAAADKQLAEKLASASVAAVTLSVAPAEAAASLQVSSFAPDESFGPRTIHLSLGQHVVTAQAAGFDSATAVIDVKDKAAMAITVTLKRTGESAPSQPPAADRPSPLASGKLPIASTSSSVTPWIIIGAGGGIAVTGGIVHATAYRSARNRLAASSGQQYQERTGQWQRLRTATIALYAVGAVAVATGVVLKYTVFKGYESPVAIGGWIDPNASSAMVTVGWSMR
jgi:hypothetical protein